ncbi:MAG: BACON domain-containing carbohydrate-binding protein, partial [Vicinamibacterales bacterium]
VTISQAAPSSCSYTLSPTNQAAPAGGASGSFSLTTTSGCAWTATSDASWLRITSGASGTRSGTIYVRADANTTSSQRIATISAGGRTATVTQAGANCSYTVSPTSVSATSAARTGTVSVTATSGCTWTSSSSASWITITSGGTGTGNGSVGYSLAANTGSSQRTGSMTIAGRTVPVTQSGTSCSFTLSTTSLSIPAAGGTASGNVTASSGCAWTTSSAQSWLTVSAGTSGNGSFTVTAQPNTSSSSRTGSVTVAGQTVNVTQAGSSSGQCAVTLSPTSQSIDRNANDVTIQVTAGPDCSWTAQSDASWLPIRSGASGTGIGTVTLRSGRNPPAERTATITVNGSTATVTQVTGNLPRPPKGLRITSE